MFGCKRMAPQVVTGFTRIPFRKRPGLVRGSKRVASDRLAPEGVGAAESAFGAVTKRGLGWKRTVVLSAVHYSHNYGLDSHVHNMFGNSTMLKIV